MPDFSYEVYEFVKLNTEKDVILISLPEYHGIFIPDFSIFIHCVCLSKAQNYEQDFCLNLTQKYAQEHILTIHLWEDQWFYKKEVIQSRLISFLQKSNTIPARLTKVERIDKNILEKFITDNHLNINTQAKFKYGLFLPQKYFRIFQNPQNKFAAALIEKMPEETKLLVAVASFSGGRKIEREEMIYKSYELIRFANLKGFSVVGGLQKLISAFVREQNPDDLVSYADRDWSAGNSYKQLDFQLIDILPAQHFFIDSQTFERFYPHKLSTNSLKQYYNCWNTGSLKFLKKIKNKSV